jgi:hypothetical protein
VISAKSSNTGWQLGPHSGAASQQHLQGLPFEQESALQTAPVFLRGSKATVLQSREWFVSIVVRHMADETKTIQQLKYVHNPRARFTNTA